MKKWMGRRQGSVLLWLLVVIMAATAAIGVAMQRNVARIHEARLAFDETAALTLAIAAVEAEADRPGSALVMQDHIGASGVRAVVESVEREAVPRGERVAACVRVTPEREIDRDRQAVACVEVVRDAAGTVVAWSEEASVELR